MRLYYDGKHQQKGEYEVKDRVAEELLTLNEWKKASETPGDDLLLVKKKKTVEKPEKKAFIKE